MFSDKLSLTGKKIKTEYKSINNIFTEISKIKLKYSEKMFDFMSNHMYNRNRHKG